MRSAEHRDPPELIPYASHIAQGTGRTPIGIILFASSHLLLGGVIVLAIGRFMSQMSLTSGWMKLFAVAMVVMSFSMLGGATMLLMKGRGAWMLAITAFTWLAVSEIIMAALGLGWWMSHRSSPHEQPFGFFYYGGGMAIMASALLALCLIVLKYLGSAKARDTFALPRGETPALVRALPLFLLTMFVAAMIFAGSVGADMSL
jgi:hypothetical protein